MRSQEVVGIRAWQLILPRYPDRLIIKTVTTGTTANPTNAIALLSNSNERDIRKLPTPQERSHYYQI